MKKNYITPQMDAVEAGGELSLLAGSGIMDVDYTLTLDNDAALAPLLDGELDGIASIEDMALGL